MIQTGERFNISHDEWSSLRRRRYLNIIVHHKQTNIWNLGLIRVNGSMDAQTIVQKIEERLRLHGISIDSHVICQMTDGCKTMLKVGKISTPDQQLCLAHGIQLAVLDVLYGKKENEPNSDDATINDKDCLVEIVESDDIEENDLFAFAEDVVNEEESMNELNTTSEEDEYFNVDFSQKRDAPELVENYKHVVDNVRTIVKKFKRSPVKNDVLQCYIRSEFGQELQLKLDCKTRWNAMFDMLDRFHEVRKPIKKALVDIVDDDDLDIEEHELRIVSEMVEALKPVKAAVEALCRRDANLLTADAILSFTMNELQNQNTGLSMALYNALEERILERRTDLSGVLKYLHTGTFSQLNDTDTESEDSANISAAVLQIFDIPNRKTVEKTIIDLLVRLEPKENDLKADQLAQVNEIKIKILRDVTVIFFLKNFRQFQFHKLQNLTKTLNDPDQYYIKTSIKQFQRLYHIALVPKKPKRKHLFRNSLNKKCD